MIATIIFFPIVVRKVGALGLFRLLALSYPILYLVMPYLALVPETSRTCAIYGIIIWKCTFATFSYPANAMLLTNSAPSLLLLGTINGVAASTASLSRALGPTLSGILYSIGLSLGYSGLAWWCTAFITVIGALISLQMTDKGGRMDVQDEKEDDDKEACVISQSIDHVALDPTFGASPEPR